MLASLLLILGTSLLGCRAVSTSGNRVLAVVDPKAFDLADYSLFFGDLRERSFDVTYRAPSDASLELFVFGERAYDHLIITPPSTRGLGGALTAKTLVDFVHSGGNILTIFTPDHTPESVASLGHELGFELAPRESVLVDHFNYDSLTASESHDVLVLNPLVPSANAILKSHDDPIVYNGSAFSLMNGPLIVPILRAPSVAYTYTPEDEMTQSENPWVAGDQAFLVAGFQANNNARVVFAASSDLFSDRAFKTQVKRVGDKSKQATSNRQVAADISKWAFEESGVLQLDSVSWWSDEEEDIDETGSIYRVGQNISYSAKISEWDGAKWAPFVPPEGDHVQLEFRMLDPYYRLNLTATPGESASSFDVTFKIPDQHGVFTFLLSYKRPGYSYIEDKQLVTVRHLANDEFARSWEIPSAWVYVSSFWSIIAGWFVFILFYLFTSKPASHLKAKKSD